MPNHTVYVSIADEDLWKALPNKSAWISLKLNERSEPAAKDYTLCKHGAVVGMCKKGCK